MATTPTTTAATLASTAPPAVMPRCPRYLSLDIWRGFACLFVIFDHSVSQDIPLEGDAASLVIRFFRHLWIGVPMFFVISGYCISATADASRLRFGTRASVVDYFRRRIRRIYPPYWVWAGIVCLLTLGLSAELFNDPGNRIRGPLELTAGQWLGNITLTETWRWHLGGGDKGLIIGHAWTLCYEEQFYFVTGAILLLCPRHYFRAAIGVSLATIALCVVSRVLKFSIDGFFFDGRWLLFALGIALYYRVNYATARFTSWMNIALAALLLTIVVAPIHYDKQLEYGTAVGFALLASAIHQWDRQLADARLLMPIKFCGIMCYSLYLVHWPLVLIAGRSLFLRGMTGPGVTLLVTVPLCLAIAVTAGWFFHRLVERRFLNPPRRVVVGETRGETLSATANRAALDARAVEANTVTL